MPIWVVILIEVVKNLPTIIKVIKEISDMIKGLPKARKSLELKNLAMATKTARNQKDFRPLLELRERLRLERQR